MLGVVLHSLIGENVMVINVVWKYEEPVYLVHLHEASLTRGV